MFELFSAVGFANAGLLAGALATPLLVIAYLRRRSERSTTVSSLVLLQKLSKKRTLRRRFKPPLRFFLELLALLLLIAAASGPFWQDERKKIALVLDTSLSMRAEASATTGAKSRLENAVDKLADYLTTAEGDNQYTVFSSAPILTAVGEKFVGASEALSNLRKLEAAVSSDSLEAALVELGESASYDQILVASDKKLAGDLPSIESSDNSDLKSKTTAISVITVGNAASNYYIAGLEIGNGGISSPGKLVIANVAYSGRRNTMIELSLLREKVAGGRNNLRREDSQKVEIKPGQLNRVEFSAPQSTTNDEVFRVEINPLGNTNSLSEDDTAWISSDGGSGTKLLLVSPLQSSSPSATAKLGLENLVGIQSSRVTPEEYSLLSREEIKRYSLIVFHRTAPAIAPKVPSLLVLPPTENKLFPISTEINNAKVSSWTNEHPITAYLKVHLINPQSAALFAVPLWAQSVINAESGSLVAAGESRGVRFVAVGMELFPFEGTRTPLASVLLLNVFNWLSGGNQLSSSTLTGSSVKLEPNQAWEVLTPALTTETIAAQSAETSVYTATQPGPYRLTRVGGKQTANSSQPEIFVVNNFYPLESATFTRGTIAVSEQIAQREVSTQGTEPFWQILAIIALTVLTIEYLLHFHPGRKLIGETP